MSILDCESPRPHSLMMGFCDIWNSYHNKNEYKYDGHDCWTKCIISSYSWCNLKGLQCTMIQTASRGSWTRNGRILLRKNGLRYVLILPFTLCCPVTWWGGLQQHLWLTCSSIDRFHVHLKCILCLFLSNPFLAAQIFEDGINEPSNSSRNLSGWAEDRNYLVSPINGVLKYHRLGNQERSDPNVPFEMASLIVSDVSLTVNEVLVLHLVLLQNLPKLFSRSFSILRNDYWNAIRQKYNAFGHVFISCTALAPLLCFEAPYILFVP